MLLHQQRGVGQLQWVVGRLQYQQGLRRQMTVPSHLHQQAVAVAQLQEQPTTQAWAVAQ
jgi:hypothetical protein